jgi:hypothetical protein
MQPAISHAPSQASVTSTATLRMTIASFLFKTDMELSGSAAEAPGSRSLLPAEWLAATICFNPA